MRKKITAIALVFTFSFGLLFFNNCYSKDGREEIIGIINGYETLIDLFLTSLEKDPLDEKELTDIKVKIERYIENSFNPVLPEIKTSVCSNNDQDLLHIFLKLLIKASNSADQSPYWTLANIYIDCPNLVFNEQNLFKQNPFLVDILDYGFQTVTHGKENQIENFDTLQRNIRTLAK